MNFVDFDTAQKLHHIGFNDFCFAYYPREHQEDDENPLAFYCADHLGSDYKDLHRKIEDYNTSVYSVPTIDEAVQWLKRKHKIYIVCSPQPSFDSISQVVFKYKIYWGSNGLEQKSYSNKATFHKEEDCLLEAIDKAIHILKNNNI